MDTKDELSRSVPVANPLAADRATSSAASTAERKAVPNTKPISTESPFVWTDRTQDGAAFGIVGPVNSPKS
jgi:hypothetical protein